MAEWAVPKLWPGKRVFVVAGGPSFTPEHAEMLRGRPVIAVNSAWRSVPFCDVLIFGDARWWRQIGRNTTKDFKGEIVGTCAGDMGAPVRMLQRLHPPRWASDPRFVSMRWTTITGALNFADHAGASDIVICGLDGKLATDGTRHHHGEAYPWPLKADSFANHAAELASVAPAIAKRGITVTIANPDSLADCWPKAKLETLL